MYKYKNGYKKYMIRQRIEYNTREQKDFIQDIKDLCDVDNINVEQGDIDYYMSECDNRELEHIKSDLIQKSMQISIDLFK